MKETVKILTVIGILTAGIMAQKMDLLDLTRALAEIEDVANFWWMAPCSILLQIILYLLALPGSLVIWTLGAIYHPLPATLLVIAGGLGGGLAAYFLAANLSLSWTRKYSGSNIFKRLQNNSGFLQLCALRCVPGFPHSVINYSAGILKVRIMPFIMSTVIGFGVKGYLYCSAVYTAFHIEEEARITIWTVWPLLLLTGFSLMGILVQKKFFENRKQAL